MRKAVFPLVLLVAGLLAYNYWTTGEIHLIPSFTLSEQEQEIADLDRALEAARQEFTAASRAAGLAGIDSTSDVRAARVTLARVEKELADIERHGLESGGARKRARQLEAAIEDFKRRIH